MPWKVGDVAWRPGEIMVEWGSITMKNFSLVVCRGGPGKSCANVRILDRTSPPTSRFWTQFGSDIRPNFGLYVRIGIGHGPNFGPISVRIGIGHVPALSRVLFMTQRTLTLNDWVLLVVATCADPPTSSHQGTKGIIIQSWLCGEV